MRAHVIFLFQILLFSSYLKQSNNCKLCVLNKCRYFLFLCMYNCNSSVTHVIPFIHHCFHTKASHHQKPLLNPHEIIGCVSPDLLHEYYQFFCELSSTKPLVYQTTIKPVYTSLALQASDFTRSTRCQINLKKKIMPFSNHQPFPTLHFH